jgi:NAD(P) transhydrogenase subunit alpha
MKTMNIGVLAETCPNETRVALTPGNIAALLKRQLKVVVEQGAGVKAGHSDQDYLDAGATIGERAEIIKNSDALLQVQSFGSNKVNGDDDLASLREGQIVVGMMDPLASPESQSGAYSSYFSCSKHGRAVFYGDYCWL